MPSLVSLVADRPLKMGMSGPAVGELQSKLAGIGYPLTSPFTRYFGSVTDSAVEDLQRRNGLKVDGEVGEDTAKVVEAAFAKLNGSMLSAKPEIVRPMHLQISISHIGLKEGAGSKDNPELVNDIQEVAKDYFHDSTPWCAGWVSFCLARASLKPSDRPLWALSYSEGWGIKLSGPAVGAVAVKHRDGGGHVTFIAGRTASGRLACCGGNQNDMVSIAGYPADVFDGFYYPKELSLPTLIGFRHLPIVDASGGIVSEA